MVFLKTKAHGFTHRSQPISHSGSRPASPPFIDTAREVGADESPEAFERAFEKVVRPKDVEPKSKPKDAPQDAS